MPFIYRTVSSAFRLLVFTTSQCSDGKSWAKFKFAQVTVFSCALQRHVVHIGCLLSWNRAQTVRRSSHSRIRNLPAPVSHYPQLVLHVKSITWAEGRSSSELSPSFCTLNTLGIELFQLDKKLWVQFARDNNTQYFEFHTFVANGRLNELHSLFPA